ncbi:MAG: ferritin family protein [Caldicoprobacterales bacterium]|jgi:rubrerythrin|nr:ferritin family protein [Clostridiales bacterium]
MGTAQYTYEYVISYAIIIEQRGIKLYEDAANELDYEPAKNILLHLAEQERMHEKYFMKLKDEMNSSRRLELNDEAVGYLSVLVESEILPEDNRPFNERFKTLQDVIEFGMQTEKDSILFYTQLSMLDWDEGTKKVLHTIIQEEKKHLIQLVELRNLIEERDVYY